MPEPTYLLPLPSLHHTTPFSPQLPPPSSPTASRTDIPQTAATTTHGQRKKTDKPKRLSTATAKHSNKL